MKGAVNKGWQERRHERQLAQKLKQSESVDAEVLVHVKSMNLNSLEDYQNWCTSHGLSPAAHKSPHQRKKELELSIRVKGEAALAGMKRHSRRPRDTIDLLYKGDIDRQELRHDHLLKIHDAFAHPGLDAHGREAFLNLLLHVEQNGDLFGTKPAISVLGPQEGNTFIEGLRALASHYRLRIRPLDLWKSDSHNSRRQFGSLARHLLAKYDVPVFMDAAWFRTESEETSRQQNWFVHIGTGQNIRTSDIPVQLTKKMAHLFLQAPDQYTIEEALRWGQILGLEGEQPLVRTVIGTRLGTTFENEDFWKTVIHFFVNNPMLDPDHVGPIVDFIYNQKYVPQEIAQPGGEILQLPPAQPNFSVKSRSILKLLNQVEQWHRQLARDTRLPHRQWEPSGLDPLEMEENSSGSGEKVQWSIKELLSTKQLQDEGKAMGHCVGSYAQNCQKGNTSIWSMQVGFETGSPYRVMTIAVNSSRRITQARGRYNALPSGKLPNGSKRKVIGRDYAAYLRHSKRILFHWREQESLTMSLRA